MNSKVFFVLFFTVCALVSCNPFSSDEKEKDELGWDTSAMPSQIKGEWFRNTYNFMNITSKNVVVENRQWGIIHIHRLNDEYRLVVKSGSQYMAVYFREIQTDKMDVSFGLIMYTPYDAKIANRESWMSLNKEENA